VRLKARHVQRGEHAAQDFTSALLVLRRLIERAPHAKMENFKRQERQSIRHVLFVPLGKVLSARLPAAATAPRVNIKIRRRQHQ
jgi:hypothetical protein